MRSGLVIFYALRGTERLRPGAALASKRRLPHPKLKLRREQMTIGNVIYKLDPALSPVRPGRVSPHPILPPTARRRLARSARRGR